ncbi:hypothetical protein [Rhodopirellula europaea]|uniref:hypothetical protein n=1 Tax=Rhodopirellula europaea TaxID=1263866 RepID=UPI0013923BD6|nr:hypothetical protein [Rhodopirellula europaea]
MIHVDEPNGCGRIVCRRTSVNIVSPAKSGAWAMLPIDPAMRPETGMGTSNPTSATEKHPGSASQIKREDRL